MARRIELQFPQGVARRLGLRATSKARSGWPAPWAMNVRLQDSLTDRLRGGSFTAISAAARPELVYRDRLLTFADNVVTASRVGEHGDRDLNYDVSDTLRATIFQFSEAGEVGEDVVALVPHKDAHLLGFTSSETWVQSGDPLVGPRRRVSDQVGIIGPDAWCIAHDTVYFLSSHGLYSVGADGSGLKAISEDVLPESLTGVADTTTTLTYQHSDRGVYIHYAGVDWFYDIVREQFWPFDTTTTDSHILFGPIKLGSYDRQGLIQEMHGVMAQDSATVNWRIVPGATAEEAAANGKLAVTAHLAGTTTYYYDYIRAHGSWEEGRSQTARPRVSAMWVCIWLQSEGDWAFEGLTLSVVPHGAWRK